MTSRNIFVEGKTTIKCICCHALVFIRDLTSECRKKLCKTCFSKIKQFIIEYYSKKFYGVQAIRKQILSEFEVALSCYSIKQLLKSWGYDKRTRSEAIKLRFENDSLAYINRLEKIKAKSYEQRQNNIKLLEKQYGQPVKIVFSDLFHKQELSYSDISNKLSIPTTTLKQWFRFLNIKSRTVQEATKTKIYRKKQSQIKIVHSIRNLRYNPKTLAYIRQNIDNREFIESLSNEQINDLIKNYGMSELLSRDRDRLRMATGILILDIPHSLHCATDDELIKLAQVGDEMAVEYLIDKYKKIIHFAIKKYYLIGGDRSDLIQEGLIGLYEAIRGYRSNKKVSFAHFAKICITRQIIDAVKFSTRQKHILLNSYISLNKPIYDADSDRTLLDVLSNEKSNNPDEIFFKQVLDEKLKEFLYKHLSELENDVLQLYLEGYSYQEMATIIKEKRDGDTAIKSIDNALRRVRKKIKKHFKDGYYKPEEF